MVERSTGDRKRVLVVSVGLSPQVVTETLHALWSSERWLPDQLVLLVTPRAAEVARAVLLDPDTGAIAAWSRDWSVPAAAALAREAMLVVVPTDSGDLDGERSATALADCAWRLLSGLVADARTELHVSIAGGRKPAAAILGILMAVLGRAQDRMSHVLLIPEAAAGAGLFYPSRRSHMVLAGAGATVDAADLRPVLVDIPFPRLARASTGSGGLEAFFARLSQDGQPVRLLYDQASGRLSWDGVALSFPPAIAAFVAWLAREQAEGGVGLPRAGASRAGYLSAYRAIAGAAAAARAAARLADPLDPEWMEEKVARANKLADACGIRPRGARLVQSSGTRARAVYRLALDPAEIAVTRNDTGGAISE